VLLAFFPFQMVVISAFGDYLHWNSAVQATYGAIELYLPGDMIDAIRTHVPPGGMVQRASLLSLLALAVPVFYSLQTGLNRALGLKPLRGRLVNLLLMLGLAGVLSGLAFASFVLTALAREGRGVRAFLLDPAALLCTIAGLTLLYRFLAARATLRQAVGLAIPVGLALEAAKLAVVDVAPLLRTPLHVALGPFYDALAILPGSFVAILAVLTGANLEPALAARRRLAVGLPAALLAIALALVYLPSRSATVRPSPHPVPDTPPQTRTFEPRSFSTVFSGAVAPVLRVNPGDTIRTTTLDYRGFDAGHVQRSQPFNPQTGPVYIEGTLPGDTLVVRLARVRLNRDSAESGTQIIPRAVTDEYFDAATNKSGLTGEWTLDRSGGFARLASPTPALRSFRAGLQPMLGCIGVAPPRGQSFRTDSLGSWGGNLDYREIREGTTVYLPVYQPGALLFVGDGHALEGDGELNLMALETSLDLELVVNVIPGQRIEDPRAENDGYLMVMGIDETLDRAVRRAVTGLARWIEADYHLAPEEAAAIIGSSVHFDVAEIADPQVNIVAKLNKAALAALR